MGNAEPGAAVGLRHARSPGASTLSPAPPKTSNVNALPVLLFRFLGELHDVDAELARRRLHQSDPDPGSRATPRDHGHSTRQRPAGSMRRHAIRPADTQALLVAKLDHEPRRT